MFGSFFALVPEWGWLTGSGRDVLVRRLCDGGLTLFENSFVFLLGAVMAILSGVIRCCLLCGVMLMAAPHAALGEIITYSLVNVPAVQNGHTLSGTLVLDTTGLTSSSGGWLVLNSQATSFTSWSFSVSGANTYSANSSDGSAVLEINGSNLFATPTALEIDPASSLLIGIRSVLTTSVQWQNDISNTSLYFSNQGSQQRWLDSASADSFNTFVPGTLAGSFVMATAVPEPSTFAMLITGIGIVGCGGVTLRRRFRHEN